MQFIIIFIIFGLGLGLAASGLDLLIGGGKTKNLRPRGGLILGGAIVLFLIGYLIIKFSGYW